MASVIVLPANTSGVGWVKYHAEGAAVLGRVPQSIGIADLIEFQWKSPLEFDRICEFDLSGTRPGLVVVTIASVAKYNSVSGAPAQIGAETISTSTLCTGWWRL